MDRPCHKQDLAMRALRTHERGGPEHLVEEEAPVPSPGTGDALVRVHAASFTPTELGWRDVSRLEQRDDVKVSTLRRYLRALEADLELVVVLKTGHKMRLDM